MENITEIIRIGRFRFLIAGFLLFSMGTLLAAYRGAAFSLNRFLLGYLTMGLGHLSVSYSNEYFDRDSDRFGTPSAIAGGSGVLVRRPDLAVAAYRLGILLIALSLCAGLIFYILFPDSLSFLALALFGNLLGWYYSAPPLRFVARGWGEAATAIGIGGVVPVMGYLVIAEGIDPAFALFCIPLFCYGCYFIMSVEIPDAEADRRAGKRTLVAIRGRQFGQQVIIISALAATLWYLMLSAFIGGFLAVALFSLIPLAAGIRGYPATQTAVVQNHRMQENVMAVALFCLLADGFLLMNIIP
ncbi:prenyltransferase [Methanogenium sp. S4BF]|uniref:prenyltransferase n=1 Tax=Methanogenium sp. S4BF TaxID=1789226 RepID=UPI002417FB97|nr:prenyltransferase [Methanogenium sp. S4BF]WFN33914.1 prenyltransferase [Methanogenium sp. S4BF]